MNNKSPSHSVNKLFLVDWFLSLLFSNLYQSGVSSVQAARSILPFTLSQNPTSGLAAIPSTGIPSSHLNEKLSSSSLDSAEKCTNVYFFIPASGKLGWGYKYPGRWEQVYSTDHTGVDIFGSVGDHPVFAAYLRTVIAVGSQSVKISHNDPLVPGRTIQTYYSPLQNIKVNVNDPVTGGQQIAEMGAFNPVHLPSLQTVSIKVINPMCI